MVEIHRNHLREGIKTEAEERTLEALLVSSRQPNVAPPPMLTMTPAQSQSALLLASRASSRCCAFVDRLQRHAAMSSSDGCRAVPGGDAGDPRADCAATSRSSAGLGPAESSDEAMVPILPTTRRTENLALGRRALLAARPQAPARVAHTVAIDRDCAAVHRPERVRSEPPGRGFSDGS